MAHKMLVMKCKLLDQMKYDDKENIHAVKRRHLEVDKKRKRKVFTEKCVKEKICVNCQKIIPINAQSNGEKMNGSFNLGRFVCHSCATSFLNGSLMNDLAIASHSPRSPLTQRRQISPARELTESLNNLLSDERGVRSFLEFLVDEYSVEYLLFYFEILQFKEAVKNGVAASDMLVYAKSIFRKYLQCSAEFEIQISPIVVQQVVDNLQDPISPQLFDGAFQESINILKNILFPRFQRSSYCKKLVSSDSRIL